MGSVAALDRHQLLMSSSTHMLGGFSPRAYTVHRRYCHLPVSGRNMKRFLQFRLDCHKLPIATGCRAGVVRPGLSGPRASRHCTFCSAGALGDERHLVYECASLAALRAAL